MSHTLREGDTYYRHNGDFSGNITFNVKLLESDLDARWGEEPYATREYPDGIEVSIPFSHVVSLVAEYIRNEKISQLEQASDEEMLFGMERP